MDDDACKAAFGAFDPFGASKWRREAGEALTVQLMTGDAQRLVTGFSRVETLLIAGRELRWFDRLGGGAFA